MNVLFVHGWGCGWQDWTAVTSLLPDDVRIGLSKLPGSPDAVPLEGAISLKDCAAQIIFEADGFGFDRFALVGHSMGARIALELAAHWPGRVSRLLLIDGSNVPEDPDKAVARLKGQLVQFGQPAWAEAAIGSMMVENLNRDQKQHLVTRAAGHSTDTLLAYYYAMAAWDRDDFITSLGRITCPVTVLQSTSLDENEVRQSVTTYPSSLWLDAIRSHVTLAEVRMVLDTGHFVMLEHPQLVSSWIKETPRTGSGSHCGNFELRTNEQLSRSLT
jgi:pimeloyl-ACP methyl ester carboxylesterase